MSTQPLTYQQMRLQVMAEAQGAHDSQFGAIARKLAMRERLAKLDADYIQQLETEVQRLTALVPSEPDEDSNVSDFPNSGSA